MKQIYNKISPLIESQIPSFYKEEGPFFVAFVQEYYKWLESTNNPLYYSRNLLSFRDIDSTLDEFLPHFQQKYLNNISFVNVVDKRQLVKNALEIYRSKGTIYSLRLLFRLLFREEIDVYYPGDDILRTSNGVWITPTFVELTPTDRAKNFVGKTITGTVSGAHGFVESVVRKNNNGKVIDVAYLSDVFGDFTTGELVTDDGRIPNSPQVIGSLSELLIDAAGSGFEIGQVLDVLSTRSGKNAKARVTDIGVRTGEVNYRLIDGGYGYTLNANVFGTSQKIFVSANVLSLTSFIKTDPFSNGFIEDTSVKQPLVNVVFTDASSNLASNTIVYGSNAGGNLSSAGFIIEVDQAGNTGWALISPRTLTTINLTNVVHPNNTGSYILDEIVYQDAAVGQQSLGTVVFANSTAAIIDRGPNTLPIDTLLRVKGRQSNCSTDVAVNTDIVFNSNAFVLDTVQIITGNATANVATTTDLSAEAVVVGANLEAVGIKPSLNPFISNFRNYVYNTDTNEFAYVTSVSSGDPGGVKIGAISNTETVYLNTNLLSDSNAGNVEFLSVLLDSSNSNTASNTGFGFPALPQANLSSVIGTALSQNAFTIGTIATLTERNPGSNNTSKPFVLEKEYIIAGFGKKEVKYLYIDSSTGTFAIGEDVKQNVNDPALAVGVTAVTGTFNNINREIVKQIQANGNIVYGELYTASVVGGSGTLRIRVSDPSNSFNTSNLIVGVWSNAIATPTNVSVSNLNIQVVGNVIDANSSLVTIKKRSFFDFSLGQIEGASSGTTANVIFVAEDASSNVIGNNASIDAAAGISNGTIVSVEVIDSGNFYEEGESVTLYAANNQITGRATVKLGKQGSSRGYWKDTKGFLNSNKYIQDNEYYQEFSYEIQTGVNRQQYEDIIKNTVHMAGTKMFSKFSKKINTSNLIQLANTTYDKLVQLEVVDETGLQVGEVIQQEGNIALGTIVSSDSAINTITIAGVQGVFMAGANITGSTSNTTTTIITTNIVIT